MTDLSNLTLASAVAEIKKKTLSPADLIDHQIKEIEKDNQREDKINAVLHYDREVALKQAESTASTSPDSLLAGVPIFIKNCMHMQDYPVSSGSKILDGYRSPYTGGAIKYLLSNGGSVIGSTNMDEFAMGSSNETSYYGKVRNPLNRDYIPGGSSGGSAAVVASSQGIAALGSDTGGSIRQPAACCGIVGLKPTYGRVSRYGLVAFASSFDQIGPITQTVEDAALLLQAVAGFDERDSTSVDKPVPNYLANLEKPIKDYKIALPKEYFANLAPEVSAGLEKVIDFYRKSGCQVDEVSLPTTEYGIAIYYILATAEASANLSRFDGIRYSSRSEAAKNVSDIYFHTRGEGFGKEVKRRILTGTYVLSSGYHDAYYLQAQKARRAVYNDYIATLKEYDAILTPTLANGIFKLGEKINDPIAMYQSDLCTVSANVTGIPGISLPIGSSGIDKNGMPISFQIMGAPFKEESILHLGHVYQKENS